MKRVVILASGAGTLAQAIFAAPKDYEVAALICDRAGARVMEIAREFEIEVELLELIGDRSNWNQDIFDLVSKYQPDLVVSAGFMRILAPDFVLKILVFVGSPVKIGTDN